MAAPPTSSRTRHSDIIPQRRRGHKTMRDSMQWGSLPLSTQIAVYAVVLVFAWLLAARLRSVHQRQVLNLSFVLPSRSSWL